MEFQSLELFTIDLAEKYKELFKQSRTQIADACPNSRFAWNVGYNYRYFILENCICLISDGGIFTDPHFALPIGDLDVAKLEKILPEIKSVFDTEGWTLTGLFIDEEYVDMFNQLTDFDFQWTFDEDFSDYLYVTDDLANLKGKKYRVKRNHVNRFIRDYPEFQYRKLRPSDREEAINLVKTWCQEKDIDCHNPLESDCGPIDYLFRHWEELDIYGGAIFYNNELIAFTMGSLIDEGKTAVLHFEKANPAFEGLYAVINQFAAFSEFEDTKYINREEDMGDSGLRVAKESYFPIKKIKKYRLELINT